jgi:hypothetical protein
MRLKQGTKHSSILSLLKVAGVLLMLGAYMILFYNASAEDNGSDSSDLYAGHVDWISMVLTLLLGVSQGVEIYDHAIGHHHHDHSDSLEDKTLARPFLIETHEAHQLSINDASVVKRLSPTKLVIRSTIPLALGGFGVYAIWNQVNSFAQGNLIIAVPVFAANLCRFILLPGRHVKALVTGTEHQLIHEVTDIQSQKIPFSTLKKSLLFLLYSACHVADSQLLSNQTTAQPVVYWLSVIGLSCSVASYHVTHSMNITATCKKLKKLSCGKKITALLLAFMSGGLHGVQSLLGLAHLWKKNQPLWILGAQGAATAVEFVTGSIDALQHISMWATSHSPPTLESPEIPSSFVL